MVNDIAVQDFVNAIKEQPTDTNRTYNATVSRIDNEGVVWVNIHGSDKETPTASTSTEVKRGDAVTVNWRNNKLYIGGNYSNPSAGTNTVMPSVEYITGLVEKNVSVENINSATGYINDLTSERITAGDIQAATGYIDNLTASGITASDISADHATVGSLDSNYAHITNGVIDNASIGYADVADLDAHYAEIDLANVNNAWIQSGVVKDAAITNEMVQSLSANKLTAGTIDASNITVTNLNASNITAGSITVDGITIDVENNEAVIDGGYIEDGTITMNGLAQSVKDAIDGAIETYTGTVVPTLNNTPASSWNTTALKDQHIGDVYYVVNSQSQQNGYCYRFTKSGNTYDWQLIKDSDVTAALVRLQTAEGKIGDIEAFDQTMATFKTDTEGEISTLQTKTTNLETSLGDKVDTSTFNELSQTVDGNSASITTLTTTVQNKADSSTVTTLSNTVNNVSQKADSNESKISNLTTLLQTNADGTTKSTDIVHQVSDISQDLDSITTRVGKTEVQILGQYATSSTAKGTAAKTATITPAATGWTLYPGATITVKFTNENTATTPTLNINSTGAKTIKTYSGGALSADEYKWKAGSTFTFTYNGTYWLMQDSSVATRITSAESSITLNATNIESKVSKDGVISAIRQSAETVKIQASKVEIDGTAIFNAISSDVDDAITDKGYATTTQAQGYATTAKNEAIAEIPTSVSELDNDSGYQTSSQVSNAVSSGISSASVSDLSDGSAYSKTVAYSYNNAGAGSGYAKICNLTPVSGATYFNQPIRFDISTRSGKVVTTANIVYINTNVTAEATLALATYNGDIELYYLALGNSSYDIYFRLGESYDEVKITNFYNPQPAKVTVTWAGEYYGTAVPSGAVKFTQLTGAVPYSTVTNGINSSNAREQRIYYRTTAAKDFGESDYPTTWVSESTANVYNAWTTKIPPLAASTASGQTKYLYLYTCLQRQTVGGTLTHTMALLDETTTVIDGGTIVTGTVSANAVNASSGTFNVANIPNLSADKITAGTISVDRMPSGTLNSEIQVGGRNLLQKSTDASLFNWSQNGGAKTITPIDGGATITITELPVSGSWGVLMHNDANLKSKIEAGEKYTISYDLMCTAAVSDFAVTGNIRNANGADPLLADIGWMGIPLDADTWHHIKIPTAARDILPTLSGQTLYLAMPTLKNQLCSFSVKNIKVEKGEVATDWTLAPEDVQSEIDAKKSIHTLTSSSNGNTYANILAWTAEGRTNAAWGINTTATPLTNVKVGDTCRIAFKVTDMNNAIVYCVGEVTSIGDSVVYMTMHGLDTTVISGGNILTNSISANQIAANSIGARHLVISDNTNLVTANEFTEASLPSNLIDSWRPSISDGYLIKYYAGNSALILTNLAPNNFNQNDELYYEFYAKAEAAGNVSIVAFAYNSANANVGSDKTTHAITTTEAKYSGTIKLASSMWNTAAKYLLGFYDEKSTKSQIYVRKVVIRRKSAGELIVDGSITADKLHANSITIGKINQNDSATANALLNKNVEVGGSNLLRNSKLTDTDFPSDTYAHIVNMNGVGGDEKRSTGWYYYMTSSQSTNPDSSGGKMLWFSEAMLANMGITYGDTVTVSIDVRGKVHPSLTYNGFRLCANDRNANWWYGTGVITVWGEVNLKEKISETEFIRTWATITLPQKTSASEELRLGFGVFVGKGDESTTYWAEVRNAKVEKGNKPTSWTPSVEEVQGNIDEVADDAAEAINKLSEAVSKSIGDLRTELGGRIDALNTLMGYKATAEQLTAANAIINKYIGENGYMHFEGDALIISTENGVFDVAITPEAMAFRQNGQVVASLSNTRLVVESASLSSEFRMGNFLWRPLNDGQLVLVYSP